MECNPLTASRQTRRALRRGKLSFVAVAVTFALVSACQSQPEAGAVREATRLAMESMQQIGAIDALSPNPDANVAAVQAPGDLAKGKRPELRQLSVGRIQAMQAASQKRLRTYFAGAQLDHFLEVDGGQPGRYKGLTLRDGAPGSPAADPSITGDYVFTGGVDNFKTTRVVVDGAEATVSGTATIWLNSALVQKDRTMVRDIPGDITFTAHLVREGSQWKVDQYDDEFVPGSGP
jgi:hypothetical protein